jgi:hypothetical protein
MYTSTQRETSGISSGSIDALRVQLMKMNAQQLQAFATANQDDAIKLSLAAEADKYKKQHGQEALALMSGQQQKPPIAQQILQSIGQPPQQPQQPQQGQGMPPQGQMPPQGMPQQMAQAPQEMPPQGMAYGGVVLPEDQGIATLPVGNMNFASGGIVAFDEGGSTSPLGRFFKDLTTQTQTPEQKQLDAVQSTLRRKRAELNKQGGLFGLQQQTPQQQEIYERTKAEIDYLENLVRNPKYVPPASTPASTPAPALTAETKYDPATATRRSMYPEQSAPPATPAAVPPGTAAEPKLPAIAPTKFERTTLPSANVDDILRLYDNSMPANIVDPLAKQREEANAPAIQAAGRQVSLFEQEVQRRQPAFEERLKKLDEKEGRVKSMEDRNVNMSLLEAGLSMMAGDSPHAFVNIGKGAQVGIKSYTEGLAKVEAARDKMDEARARIEEFRRNEDMMTAKERRAVLRDYDNTVSAAQKDMFNGVEKMYGIKRQDITSAIATKFAREDTQAQLASRENLGLAGIQSSESIANAQMKNAVRVAGMPTGLERILSNPALFDKYMKSQTGAANVRAESALRQEWAENPMVRQQYPKIEDYLMANGVGGQSGGGTGLKFLGSRPAQ